MKQGKKGLYTYRRRVPTDLKQAWGIREVKVALKTADHALALKAGAEANLQFEMKAKNLRLMVTDAAQKSAIEKLEERKWIIQAATNMLKHEGVLPTQQPKILKGATLNELLEWKDQAENAKGILVSNLQDRYIDEEKRQRDYDSGRWNTSGYEDTYKPVDPNDVDSVALEILSGSTPSNAIEPTWRETADIYITENRTTAQRTPHNQKKHEQRVVRICDDLARYLGGGKLDIGYETKIADFTRLWMRGFRNYCDKTHPNWSIDTFNRSTQMLMAAYNKGNEIFELNLSNPFTGIQKETTAAHVSGVPTEDTKRRSFTPTELAEYEEILRGKRPDIKTIGILMIHTGCRTMEIGGLTFSELILRSNIPYIDIKPNHIRRLKNKSSIRQIPLNSFALDATREYLDTIKSYAPNDPLFPKYGRDGGMDPLSQNLRNIIRNTMKIEDTKLVPYSTRHTMKDKMRALRSPEHYQFEIMGHSNRNRSAEGYGDGDPLSYLREELERTAKVEDWGRGAEFRTNIN